MTDNGNRAALCLLALALAAVPAAAARGATTPLPPRSAEPYAGAIVVEARSGKAVFEDRADAQGYPASIVKLMDLLLVFEDVKSGRARLTDPVRVTAAASRIGGSQVYLKENEVFPLEELIYAVVIQSANDAATAMALHLAGSTEAFVARMNRRAAELGMKGTEFHSVHGLPPAPGQKPDVSTARDLALLSRELVLNHPRVLAYTSTTERGFRNNTFIMRTHNRLLGDVPGCDGLKTGYFRLAGYSISATAQRDGRRLIAVVLGSRQRLVREAKTAEMLAQGFLSLAAAAAAPPPQPAPATAVQPASPAAPAPGPAAGGTERRWTRGLAIAGAALALFFAGSWAVTRSRFRRYHTFR
jgi:D-alanyl-D-alanine carboxypeptidase (penicillin-binding protein 5/6)